MINVLMFNEWKESDDYKINKWFINKKIAIEDWFKEPALSELEFDYFEFDNSNSLYELYSAELYFHEDAIQYTLQFLIDAATLTESVINEADETVQPTEDQPIEEPATDEIAGDKAESFVKKIKLVLKGFNKDASAGLKPLNNIDNLPETNNMIGMTEREIDESEIDADLLLQLINEFKTEYIKEE